MKIIENLSLTEKEKVLSDVAVVCLLFAGTVLIVAGVFLFVNYIICKLF